MGRERRRLAVEHMLQATLAPEERLVRVRVRGRVRGRVRVRVSVSPRRASG